MPAGPSPRKTRRFESAGSDRGVSWRTIRDRQKTYAGVVKRTLQPQPLRVSGQSLPVTLSYRSASMQPSGYHVVKGAPCRLPIPVIAGNADPTLARCSLPRGGIDRDGRITSPGSRRCNLTQSHLRGKVATAGQIDEHIFGPELSIRHDRSARERARSINLAAPSRVNPLATV